MNPIMHVNTDELKKFHNLTDEQLHNCTINEILKLNDTMLYHKKQQQFAANNADAEYKRIMKKYLAIFPLLNQYWSEDEIVTACAKHVKISDIVTEENIPCSRISCDPHKYGLNQNPPLEYLRTAVTTVPRYTKSGEQLLYGELKKCHIYRKIHNYQGTKHGDIVLELLYQTYPELKQFEFKAYEYREYTGCYEIYPKHLMCYTPFHALLTQDIDAIIARNEQYCKSYNYGEYSPAKWNERKNSPEIQHYFDVIRSLKPITK